MNRVALYDNQHYIDREWGGSHPGERLCTLDFERVVVSARFKTAGGDGTVRLTLWGSNNDREPPELGAVLVPSQVSFGAAYKAGEVQLTASAGIVVVCWRDLPKWVVARVDCNDGLTGAGSELRVCMIGA